MMLINIKQYLSNIWNSNHEKSVYTNMKRYINQIKFESLNVYYLALIKMHRQNFLSANLYSQKQPSEMFCEKRCS